MYLCEETAVALKQGQRLTRACWSGGAYLFMRRHPSNAFSEIILVNPEKAIENVTWIPIQDDVIADDWEIIQFLIAP